MSNSVTHKVTALHEIGRVLEAVNSDAAAEDALKQILDIANAPWAPDIKGAPWADIVQHWIALRQKQCKWPVLAGWERASRKQLLTNIEPLALQCLADDPMLHLAKAYCHARNLLDMPKAVSQRSGAARAATERLRIGYLSSDLRDHAVGLAMTDVIELHDRAKFEIFAYYCGVKNPDSTQRRIMTSVDHWVDINDLDDDRAAAKIASDGIDILVDLNGFTRRARTKVFARRPAPIAVNWFGFPGTMGTPYHHYIIGDPVVIPEGEEIYYSEKVVRLPCYQPNDRKRLVAERSPSRAEMGLPEQAFVYCSFNGTQKITPRVFDRWMKILGGAPGSVLWLLTGTDDTNARLRAAAAGQGVAPERIIFAQRLPNPEHLARYPLADLFLDSLPYGAHTTAADALWMNVPILTLRGRSFPARVCASVLRSAGVGELECATPEAYVARAIEFARNRDQLAAIKTKLAAGRDSCLLFDTPRLVGHLEELYRQMWGDFKRGELPVPDLRNLDVYHEVGIELEVENAEALSEDAYISSYKEKLAAWHSHYPIAPDNRLWRSVDLEISACADRLAVA